MHFNYGKTILSVKKFEKSDNNLPTKVNNFLVMVTDSHLRVITKSAAGPAASPVMNAASGGAAVNRLFCTATTCRCLPLIDM